jgi:arylsulfatase A-like enzyme
LLAGLAAALLATSAAGAGGLLVPGSRPNVVVIMADDLDEMLLEAAVSAGFMPVFEQTFLAAGTRMTNGFVTNPLCCPSRATFLTGQYSHNHGVLTNEPPYGFGAFDDSSTLATWLTDAGYLTGFVGKYLNGYWGRKDLDGDGRYTPPGETRYVPPGWHHWQGLVDPTTYDVYGYYILNGVTASAEWYPDRYQTEVLAEKAAAFIDAVEMQDDASPFFLWVSTLAPHAERSVETLVCTIDTGSRLVSINTIRAAPQYIGTASGSILPKTASFNETNLDDKPVWLRNFASRQLNAQDVACIEQDFRSRLESLRSVDDLLGEVLAALERNGETNTTVIVFISDNGYLYGQHRLTQKLYVYEEAIKVPFYVRDLSVATARSEDLAVLMNDFAPTIAELAGATPGLAVDGRSFLPLFADERPAAWRKRFLVEHYFGFVPNYAAIRGVAGSRFLYVEYKPPGAQGNGWGGCDPGLCELYWLDGDPHQNHSQHEAPQTQGIIAGLETLLLGLRFCADGMCRSIEDQ